MSRVWIFVPSIRAIVDSRFSYDGAFVVRGIRQIKGKDDLRETVSLEPGGSFYRNRLGHLVAPLEAREPRPLCPKRLSCLFHPTIRRCCLVTIALRFTREYASAAESFSVSS